jgi:head-tail adaptor
MPAIAQMKHRVVICSSDAKLDENGKVVLSRNSEVELWAAVEEVRQPAYLKSGLNLEQEYKTHRIMTRNLREYDFTIAAWIYEHRVKSSPRWYKVMSFSDDGPYMMFETALRSRADLAALVPNCGSVTVPLPTGIKL